MNNLTSRFGDLSFASLVDQTDNWSTRFETGERYQSFHNLLFWENGKVTMSYDLSGNPDVRAQIMGRTMLEFSLITEVFPHKLIGPDGLHIPKSRLECNMLLFDHYAGVVINPESRRYYNGAEGICWPSATAFPVVNKPVPVVAHNKEAERTVWAHLLEERWNEAQCIRELSDTLPDYAIPYPKDIFNPKDRSDRVMGYLMTRSKDAIIESIRADGTSWVINHQFLRFK